MTHHGSYAWRRGWTRALRIQRWFSTSKSVRDAAIAFSNLGRENSKGHYYIDFVNKCIGIWFWLSSLMVVVKGWMGILGWRSAEYRYKKVIMRCHNDKNWVFRGIHVVLSRFPWRRVKTGKDCICFCRTLFFRLRPGWATTRTSIETIQISKSLQYPRSTTRIQLIHKDLTCLCP